MALIITNSGSVQNEIKVYLLISCCPSFLYNQPTLRLRQKKNNGDQFHCILEYELLVTSFFHFFYVVKPQSENVVNPWILVKLSAMAPGKF